MVKKEKIMTINLYENDKEAWVKQQIQALKTHNINNLDWENLAEELENFGDKEATESLLTRLYEHVVKITYWESERERNLNGWKIEINAFRIAINRKLKRKPTLKNHLDRIDDECWEDAVKTLEGLIDTFPQHKVTNWKTVLQDNWYPKF